MKESWIKALKDSISETFSTMFFMVPDEEPAPNGEIGLEPAQGWIEGWAEVTHQDQGVRIWVWASKDLADELAGNILSSDPSELSPGELLDAYREMINIVVGSLLTKVDTESKWNMSLPQAKELSAGTVREIISGYPDRLFYDVEGNPLMVGWKSF